MISLSSPAFASDETIPVRYTPEGENVSPPLEWSELSDETQELALICEDPDAPGDEPFTHWIIYGIDAQETHLPEGLERHQEIYKPVHARQGMNSARKVGYSGPMPPIPDDWHHYHFKLFALNKKLDLRAGVSRDDFYAAINKHIVDKAELVGRYHRLKRLQERPNRQSKPETHRPER